MRDAQPSRSSSFSSFRHRLSTLRHKQLWPIVTPAVHLAQPFQIKRICDRLVRTAVFSEGLLSGLRADKETTVVISTQKVIQNLVVAFTANRHTPNKASKHTRCTASTKETGRNILHGEQRETADLLIMTVHQTSQGVALSP